MPQRPNSPIKGKETVESRVASVAAEVGRLEGKPEAREARLADKSITIRIAGGDYAELRDLLGERGLSVSAGIREMIRDYVRTRGRRGR